MSNGSSLPYEPCILPVIPDDGRTVYVISDLHLGWRESWPDKPESDNPFGSGHVSNEEHLAEFLAKLADDQADPDQPMRFVRDDAPLYVDRGGYWADLP